VRKENRHVANGTAAKIASALNDLTSANSDAIIGISQLIGDIADSVGPIGTIISVVTTFINLNKPDAVQAAFTAIEAKLDAITALIGDAFHATEVRSRNTRLYEDYSSAWTNFTNLEHEIALHPNPQKVSDFITPFQTTLTNLVGGPQPNVEWNMTFVLQTYWTDAGSYRNICNYAVNDSSAWDAGYADHALPPQSGDGNVWVYSYSLPLYMLAVGMLLAAAGSLDPNYITTYNLDLTIAAGFPQGVHDKREPEGGCSWQTASNTCSFSCLRTGRSITCWAFRESPEPMLFPAAARKLWALSM
jgi:hypothetical protein